MNHPAAFVVASALFCSLGCTPAGWSVDKALGWGESKPPSAQELPPGQLATAARVENIGRTILAQNPFVGIDPLFHTVGVKEPVLFHRGTEELMISEGLVSQCKTDEQLAAVLCYELGQMIAEKRAARHVGRNVDPIPAISDGGNPVMGGGTPFDFNRQTELGLHERKFPREVQTEATGIARQLLRDAGYDPAELGRVQPLLKSSSRGEALRKQMGVSAPAPTWQK